MTSRNRDRQRGQVLPLFALFLVVLLGFAALAVDVSGAYAARRFYRSAADGAALAGAQDLQVGGTRNVTPAARATARQHAMQELVSALGISGGLPSACTNYSQDIPDACILPGTTLHVSIKAGTDSGPTAIACQTCDPARSVQVGLRNAEYQLSFARVLGQSSWNVGITSVAGLTFGKSYAVITLRPPKKTGATFNVNDISLDGGTTITVRNGDVGSNANMVYANTGGPTPAKMILDSGFYMYYYPALAPDNDPGWVPPYPADPVGFPHTEPIADPNYRYPAMSGVNGTSACPGGGSNCAPTFDDARANLWATLAGVDRADNPDGVCAAEAAKVDPTAYTFMPPPTSPNIYCYQPGIYSSGSGSKDAKITVGPGDIALLKPGAYYLKSGMTVNGRLIGGYEPGHAGVALMFDECNNQCNFVGNSALTIALNAGTKFPATALGGSAAMPAVDWNLQPVQTSGPSGPTPPILITLLVNKDPACTVPTSGQFVEPNACQASQNTTTNVAGGGSLVLEGVQYMPSDNVSISGGSSGTGRVGQIIAWTLTYSGQTRINQEGVASQGPGILRLDGACTAPGTPCNP